MHLPIKEVFVFHTIPIGRLLTDEEYLKEKETKRKRKEPELLKAGI